MMSARRVLASLVYRRRIELFDRLNLNTAFRDVVNAKFAASTPFEDRYCLYRHVHDTFVGGAAITYLEFGVLKGDSIIRWARINSHPDSRFYGFDTFTGVAERWHAGPLLGSFDLKGKTPDINDSRVVFVRGLFQKSLYPFLSSFKPTDRLVVHIDSDLYSSALFVLTVLDRLLPCGSIIIFDEFSDLQHEFAAFLDYTQSFQREWQGIAHTKYYERVAVMLL